MLSRTRRVVPIDLGARARAFVEIAGQDEDGIKRRSGK
jgi:hypothetical protein